MARKHKQQADGVENNSMLSSIAHRVQGADLKEQTENFKKVGEELKARNYIPAFVHTEFVGRNKSQTKVLEAQSKLCACNAEASAVGMYISTNRFRTPVKVSGCGAEGRGYIKVGNDNLMYVQIQKAAEALYSTSSILRFIIDLLCGSGCELRYRYTTIVNGKPEVSSCVFEDAGDMLDERIKKLRDELEESRNGKDGGSTAMNNGNQSQSGHFGDGGEGDRNRLDGGSTAMNIGDGGKNVEPMGYRVANVPKKEDPYAQKNYENVGTTEAMLEKAIQDKRMWERSMAEWQELKDNTTDLDILLRQWASDQSFFGLSYLKLELEQGLPKAWGKVEKAKSGITKVVERPKIVGVSYLPCVCSRMEEMSDNLEIENIYYAEKWRYEGTIKDMLRDVVAYRSIMPEKRKKMMEKIIIDNQNTTPSERPNVVMPLYMPAFDSPYYPIQAWWSIFSSMLFNLGNTIVNDAVTERENSTMFSYLIYINMTWFEKYCADKHLDNDESKEEAKKAYLLKISNFLKNKNNNGRIAALESISSADEKNILKSVEIVEVPRTTSKASLEDMELVGNAVFFAFGVHGAMVGSFGKNATSSSGTQQRELTLLKQCQLMPQQRLYLNAWDFILRWNNFDSHTYMSIKQYDLSTLDASKTGLVERE